ncbi:MFS transporter [Virgibacillus kimchii]
MKINISLIVSNQFLTVLADSVFNVAILWYVYEYSQSALFAAGITAVTSLINVLIGPIMGIFIDRAKPKKSMQLGYGLMISVGVLLSLVFIFWINALIAFIYISVIIHHISMLLVEPAKYKLLPQIVERDRIIKTNGYISSTSETSELIGQMISGVLISFIGFIGVMLTHSIFYLFASILLTFIVIQKKQAIKDSTERSDEVSTNSKKSTMKSDLIFGINSFKNNPPVFKLVMLAMAVNLTTIAGSLLVVLVSDHYQASAIQFGIFNASAAFVGIIVGIFAGKLTSLVRPYLVIAFDYIISGIAFLGMALTTNYYIGLLFYLMMTFTSILGNVMFGSILILLVKDQVRARINTITGALSSVVIAPTVLIGGWIADLYDVSILYVFAGIWIFLCGLFPLIDKDLKSIDV